MALTDNCDIFASFHEGGFNQIISHLRQQRPSLFNYATAALVSQRDLWCKALKVHPIVLARNNPLFTIVPPLMVPGSNVGLNFAVQVADLQIDFHPGDRFQLPPELAPPLKAQRFALHLEICGGIGCPPKDIVDYVVRTAEFADPNSDRPRLQRPGLLVLPTRQLNCFCLDAYVVGGIRIVSVNGKPYLDPFLEGFEIVDIKPDGLENSLECYIGLMLRLSVLPGLRILLKAAPLNLTQGATDLFPQPTNVTLSPTPVSAAVPNNPAIEQDLLKIFIAAEVV